MNSRPSNPASADPTMNQNQNHLQLEPAGLSANPALCDPAKPRMPSRPSTAVLQAEEPVAAEAEAVIVNNDSAAPQPLYDEPTAGVRQAYRTPVRQAYRAPVREPVSTPVGPPAGNNKEQKRPLMDARIFHRVVLPGTDFNEWFDKVSAKHFGDFETSDNGDEHMITLLRAQYLAFHAERYFGKAILDIFREVEASGVSNPGAVVNARFDDLILVNGNYVSGDSVRREAAQGSKWSSTPAEATAPIDIPTVAAGHVDEIAGKDESDDDGNGDANGNAAAEDDKEAGDPLMTDDGAAPTGRSAETPAVCDVTDSDRQDFEHYNSIVVNSSIEAGAALKIIHDRKLWRVRYRTWNSYCDDVQVMTRRYANKLIEIAGAVEGLLQVGNKYPTPSQLAPQKVTQVIPLLRLPDSEVRHQAWGTAVERSAGRQPATMVIKDVVAEILAMEDKPNPPASHKESKAQRLANLIGRLEEAVQARDWNEVDLVVVELKQCR